MSLSSMRLIAIAITALIAIAFQLELVWQSAVLSLGFGHYLLSLWYARRKLVSVASDWTTALPMIAAIVGGAALYVSSFPLLIYFAVHHVFNEVYVTNEILKKLPAQKQSFYRVTAMSLHTLLYFYVLRNEPSIRFLNDDIVLVGLIASYSAHFYMIASLSRSLSARDLRELLLLELGGLITLGISFAVPVRFLDIVCYHFIFWWFYPAVKLASKSRAAVFGYAAQTAILIGISFLLSPAGLISDYPLRDSVYLKQFLLWSHIHITSSFFLSAAHPDWIRHWFMQRKLSARATPLAHTTMSAPLPNE